MSVFKNKFYLYTICLLADNFCFWSRQIWLSLEVSQQYYHVWKFPRVNLKSISPTSKGICWI